MIILKITTMLIFWAFTPVAIAYVKADFSLPFQIWARYVSASLCLWFFMSAHSENRAQLKLLKDNLRSILMRMTVIAICTISFQLFFTYSFFIIQPAFGILLYQSQALFSLLLGVLFIREERVLMKSKTILSGIAMAVFGVILVILYQNESIGLALNIGVLMTLCAAVSWSFVGLANRVWFSSNFSPLLTATLVFSIVSVLLTPFAFSSGTPVVGEPGVLTWIVLIGSGLVGIAGGQGLFYHLMPKLGFIVLSTVQLLVPLITAVLSYLFFREVLNGQQLLGGVLLLSGCYLIISRKKRVLSENKILKKIKISS